MKMWSSPWIGAPEGVVRERITGEPGIEALERLMTGVLYKENFYDSVY
jgi:hypothetical protein